MTDKRAVIFGGGVLEGWMIGEIRKDDYVIGADRGALFLLRHGVVPHLAIGDFDSVSAEEKEWVRGRSVRFEDCDPIMKDYTDTEMALTKALQARPRSIAIYGGLGRRMDHSLANVQLLKKAADAGVPCAIVDSSNRISLVTPQMPRRMERSRYSHVSLLPLSMVVEGVTLKGFKYPLHEFRLELGSTRGISNALAAGHGEVTVRSGILLVIEYREHEGGCGKGSGGPDTV